RAVLLARCILPRIEDHLLHARLATLSQPRRGASRSPAWPGTPAQVTRRARNDAQNFGRRRLLLQRLGELLFQVGIGCAKAVNVSSRLLCLRTKTGNASSALRPFASQGHLFGTVTGSRSGRPSQGSGLPILTAPHDELAALHLLRSFDHLVGALL